MTRTPATQAVRHTVGTAAQATAREFWTATRMAGATPAGQARPEGASASVVDSARRDPVLTAAHCVYGSGYATNVAYVPEWHQGVSPYGSWAVQTLGHSSCVR